MKYYELNDNDEDASSLPDLHFCHEYKASGAPLSGAALLPPQCLDVPGAEVARLMRLTSTTVEPGATFRRLFVASRHGSPRSRSLLRVRFCSRVRTGP